MILVDANLLLYAKVEDFSQHQATKEWLVDRLNGTASVGLPWPSLLAFLRIITNPRVFPTPLALEKAWAQIREWLNRPNVWIPGPTERHVEVLEMVLDQSKATANLIPDAHLACIAIEHGLTLCSTDSDFACFEGLRWKNPIAG
jgi:toxin-antitoxin system PIN domain toxin